MLAQLQHIYKPDEVITGLDANNPTSRNVQDRLDDRVTVTDFGATGNDNDDDTIELQRAIDQLFLNPNSKSSLNTVDGIKTRVQLELPPGSFKTTSTLYIPSYTSLIGAGADKTFINFTATRTISGTTTLGTDIVTTTDANTNMIGSTITGTGIPVSTTIIGATNGLELILSNESTVSGSTSLIVTCAGPAIQFINDSSTIGDPSSISSTLGNTQPKNIELTGISVVVNTGQHIGLQLDAVKDSVFRDINIRGTWGSVFNIASKGIVMNAVSDIVTCENNLFNNINISGFSYAVYAKQDILNNYFNEFYFNDLRQGFVFGEGADQGSIGQVYGPRNNTIANGKFVDIQRHAVYIDVGSNNNIVNCNIKNVGNNGGSHLFIQYPQIYLGSNLNNVRDVSSDRSNVLNLSTYSGQRIELTLNHNVTALKGSLVYQTNTDATGILAEDVTNSNTIVLYDMYTYWAGSEYLTLFDTANNLTINGDSTPSTTNTTVRPTALGDVYIDTYINYIPEVAGTGTFTCFNPQLLILAERGSFSEAFRLPVNTDVSGNPRGSIFYSVNYQYKSINNFVRYGTMKITADTENETVQLTDEYDFSGIDDDSLLMNFRARLLNESGNVALPGQSIFAIQVQYTNTLYNDTGDFLYSYTSSF